MKDHSITQIYDLGQEVKFNNQTYRVNAFRFEARPMGIFKVYEISNENGERAELAEATLMEDTELN